MGFEFRGSGFGVRASEGRVVGIGFCVWGLDFGVWGLGFGVWGLGLECRFWGLGFRVSHGNRVSGVTPDFGF